MNKFREARKALRAVADPARAKILRRFFKTGKGEYGEGDVFLGVTVPETRVIARKHCDLSLHDISLFLKSKIHEERLLALLILVQKFERGEEQDRKTIFQFYLSHIAFVNNWDLVDLSAPKIVGACLYKHSHILPPSRKATDGRSKNVRMSWGRVLWRLARSKNLWERRIAIVATYYFIQRQRFDATLMVARLLFRDKHDLIHKAAGWMLREVGKRDRAVEEKFLRAHYRQMPRIMLRYAIERFPQKRRMLYLQSRI